MKKLQPKHLRVLAIAPSTRGFGFAVLEGEETLVDWGATEIRRDKNAKTLGMAERLIAHYQPAVLVLPETLAKNSKRSPRIKFLCQELGRLAESRKIRVALFSTEQVRRRLLGTATATKHAIAENLASRFQAELGASVPPKRRPWMSEDHRMGIFDAVALAVVFRMNG